MPRSEPYKEKWREGQPDLLVSRSLVLHVHPADSLGARADTQRVSSHSTTDTEGYSPGLVRARMAEQADAMVSNSGNGCSISVV